MRKLTEHEIIKKRELADALWSQRAMFIKDVIDKQKALKQSKAQLKATEGDFAVIQTEITTGETEQEQMELPE